MAIEKFIRGKKDDCNHDGMYSNQKRLESSEAELVLAEQLLVSMAVYQQRANLPAEMVAYHEGILRTWGLL